MVIELNAVLQHMNNHDGAATIVDTGKGEDS